MRPAGLALQPSTSCLRLPGRCSALTVYPIGYNALLPSSHALPFLGLPPGCLISKTRFRVPYGASFESRKFRFRRKLPVFCLDKKSIGFFVLRPAGLEPATYGFEVDVSFSTHYLLLV
jgi:hypothetical protein